MPKKIKLTQKGIPKKKIIKRVKKTTEEQSQLPNKNDLGLPLKDDLKLILDNFGNNYPEPNHSRNLDSGESSLLEVSLKKFIYKQKHHCDTDKADGSERHFDENTLNDVADFSKCDLPNIVELCNNHYSHNCKCGINDDASNENANGSHKVNCTTPSNSPDICGCPNCYKHDANEPSVESGFKKEVVGLKNEKFDRYNLNHIQYSNPNPRKSKLHWTMPNIWNNLRMKSKSKSFVKKAEPSFRHKEYGGGDISNQSGVTIPQLYKANIWQINGLTPGKFTFRAVTGCPPISEKKSYVVDDNYDLHSNSAHQDDNKLKTNNHQTDHDLYPKIPNNDHVFKKGQPPKEVKRIIKNSKFECNHQKSQKNAQPNSVLAEYVVSQPPPERIDIYCFDHLNTGYFRTSDHPPPLITDIALEAVDARATKFWAEIFGMVHLFVAFIITFLLQFYKFFLYGIIRPLLIGLVQLTSDYFIKPLLTVTYNGITQPLFIFFYNIATSFRDLCRPIAKGIGYFLDELANLLKAIRLAEWKHTTSSKNRNEAKAV